MEISSPARSNIPAFEPKSFCMSMTITAVLEGSTVIGCGLASRVTTALSSDFVMGDPPTPQFSGTQRHYPPSFLIGCQKRLSNSRRYRESDCVGFWVAKKTVRHPH